MKKVIFIAVIGLLTSCLASSQEQDVSINKNVGWLHGNCFAIKNSNIRLPKNITLVDLESEKRLSTATVTEKAQSGYECHALLDDRKKINLSEGYFFYKVKSESPVNMGIGYFRLGNADNLVFDYCATNEGMIFSISNSKSKSTVWEGYYYLGYESEATCPEK